MEETGEAPTSSVVISYFACLLLSVIYVGSLYVWKTTEPASHPSTIKRRFISVFFVCLITPNLLKIFINKNLIKDHSLWRILGMRFDGIINGAILPLILTNILFLGPLVMQAYTGLLRIYLDPKYWLGVMKDLNWYRIYIVAPVSEEFVFRASILSLIIHSTEPIKAVFICPLFFGAAHFHHIREQMQKGVSIKIALSITGLQFVYTSLFGSYSAYIFLRTGHLIGPILAHLFCNHMGFPDIPTLLEMEKAKKTISIIFFIFGFLLWAYLLVPMTDPSFYHNDLPWSSRI